MNPIPFLALGMIASGYAAMVGSLDADTSRSAALAEPAAEITAYPAFSGAGTDDLAIYGMDGLAASEAYDRPHCEAHATMVAGLDHDFAESLVETEVKADGLMMELYASDLMGTWTLVHKGNDGIACIVSSGTGWTASATPDMVFAKVDLAS